ncbi:MAG: acylphosphatase [bacterium]|nr:acylphosphatase [bacterium]MCX7917457.1 acylphosphatase [bacterium]MDW8163899.1 acylphosphatase [Candidatus Omnitrophota bacterium]
MKRYHIYVKGKVQGVGFRWYTERIGNRMELGGWVRNLPDGRVEIVVEGDEKKLDDFIEELKKGYLGRNIKEIVKIEEKYIGEFDKFEIRF